MVLQLGDGNRYDHNSELLARNFSQTKIPKACRQKVECSRHDSEALEDLQVDRGVHNAEHEQESSTTQPAEQNTANLHLNRAAKQNQEKGFAKVEESSDCKAWREC